MIRRYDYRLMWFNLVFLMFVAFLPVATNALGMYRNLPIVTAFYARVAWRWSACRNSLVWVYALRRAI